MSARPAHTYRSARRNVMRALKLLNRWRELPLYEFQYSLWRVINAAELPVEPEKGPAE